MTAKVMSFERSAPRKTAFAKDNFLRLNVLRDAEELSKKLWDIAERE